MTEATQNQSTQIASLDEQEFESRGYWSDAWARLLRNRLALIGLIIIVLNILIAIFAPWITPEGIDDQDTEEKDAASAWVMTLFPTLQARNETFDADGAAVVVENGAFVQAGDLIVDYSISDTLAPASGVVFVEPRRVQFYQTEDIPKFPMPANTNTLDFTDGDRRDPGETLYGNVVSPIRGRAYIVGDEIWIAPERSYRVEDQEIIVQTGQAVAVGDVLAIAEDGTETLSGISGIAFVESGRVNISDLDLISFEIDSDTTLAVRDGVDVEAGDTLFAETTTPAEGTVYLTEDTLYILPNDRWTYSGDVVPTVTSGQVVEAGEVIISLGGTNGIANMDGTVAILDNGDVVLTPLEVTRIPLDAETELLVSNEQAVLEGAPLTDTANAPVAGQVFLTEDEILILPVNSGYTPLRPEYPLGSDHLGRDIWTRLAYGARISLAVAFVGPLVSLLIGVPYGLVSGYFGGRVDNLMMRFVDLMYAFPTLLLIILLMAFFRSSSAAVEPGTVFYYLSSIDRLMGGMFFIIVGVGITSWMGLARLTRGQVLSVREQEYVLAAKSVGSGTRSIMWKHILPNVLGPIIISETLTIPTYIRYEAFLSFIGLGVNPPNPSWGNMISEGAKALRSSPHQAIFPALALFLIMFAFNFLGDGLRDALDPRMRGVD